MNIAYTSTALSDLKKIPKKDQKRILDKLDRAVSLKNPLSQARPLTGHPEFYRFRIGPWRVIVEPRDTQLVVHIIDDRKDVYRRM